MGRKKKGLSLTKELLQTEVEENGLNGRQIAEKYGIPHHTVLRRCYDHGIDVSRKDIRKMISREKFHDMYVVKQMSFSEILNEYGTVYNKTLSDLAKSWGYDVHSSRMTRKKKKSYITRRKHQHLYGSIMSSLIEGSRRRGRAIKVDITLDDIWDKFMEQNGKCALSGVDITFPRTDKDRKSKLHRASVDRIDSSKDYTKDNIQIVLKELNVMKLNHSQEKFIELCNLVSEYQKVKTNDKLLS